MTNREIYNIALNQSAIELHCAPADLLSGKNKIVYSRRDDRARAYLTLPFDCNLVTYGHGIVASTRPQYAAAVEEYIGRYRPEQCFETPQLLVLNEALRPHGLCVCFMAEYFLPDVDALRPLDCPYEIRALQPDDFAALYTEKWSNALCEKRRRLDRLCLGAYDQGELIGLAGASEDCPAMWQIGVDVDGGHRGQGVASALTSRLALHALERGKVPFYCAAWSNVASVRNAIRCGFRPAWVELTARTQDFVAPML